MAVNDAPYILIIIMALSFNVLAIDYQTKMEADKTEMSETMSYVFMESMAVTDKLNKCKKAKK